MNSIEVGRARERERERERERVRSVIENMATPHKNNMEIIGRIRKWESKLSRVGKEWEVF